MAQLQWLEQPGDRTMSGTPTFLLCMCRPFETNCHESWYHVIWHVLEMYEVCPCTKPSFAFFLDGPANVFCQIALCMSVQGGCGVTFLSSTLGGLPILYRAYTYSIGSQSPSSTSENFCNNYLSANSNTTEFRFRSFLDKMWHDIEWHQSYRVVFLGQHGSSLGKGLDTTEPGLE